jgi:hypothetical protein
VVGTAVGGSGVGTGGTVGGTGLGGTGDGVGVRGAGNAAPGDVAAFDQLVGGMAARVAVTVGTAVAVDEPNRLLVGAGSRGAAYAPSTATRAIERGSSAGAPPLTEGARDEGDGGAATTTASRGVGGSAVSRGVGVAVASTVG